ncbi:homocysteine-responsive endoplasmic reticulum-resident ubiquitin-like domain member 2 protein isoform X1 [Salmo salar]|uniref:Homocysteine-responsive endoplasmic reticulum-resident ubiquitin-like domain member 2 protein n=1 Tax=Salmo salar TaxID=8030 RepID=A0A1S3M3D0_SALSA|nr:homocysteine-responsive endoplasmic reticulum-resident ubiquitin-like domain member 2 protein isoform X1 [Salmo salar]XP_013997521.2 homocysteine-responsive endoplasmic reticulum-resident ubiquitin-like domain member 2 protein isoform X1 [Salmo salar]XP_013997522.2 homocysteine-responsive endoplasmic reticulum-resident ubiquitin-like domain member 2 protein isoform X1 [Salmo salar]XP_013997523.2 homocysteine-responsive endoplasmic reticulum-resident ubiquitin-like domain member 2 protein isof
MDLGPVILVIKAPNQKYDDQTINCFLNWTVDKLKTHISHVYPSKPSSKDQRLVYSGKLLLDHLTLKDVLRKQDEYHMVHLVCASRTPPGSPKVLRSHSNKATGVPSTSSMVSYRPSVPSQSQSTSSEESSDGLRHRTGPAPNHAAHPAFMQGYMWNQFPPQQGPPTNMPAYPGIQYNPMTLLWWQQVYARQYYMHYQMLAASSHHLRPDLLSAQPGQSDPLNPPPPEERHGDPNIQLNAQGAEALLNEEDQNCDWLDWVYTVSRAAILLSIVYVYSSFSRFVMVIGAMLLLYLHQAAWFPFNLENELQNPGDGPHQDELEADLHHDLQETERVMDDGLGDDDDDDDADSGEEGPEDPNGIPHVGFLNTTWSFIATFFMSLIPEGPPDAAN